MTLLGEESSMRKWQVQRLGGERELGEFEVQQVLEWREGGEEIR